MKQVISTIAKNYASALFDAASSGADTERFKSWLKDVVETLNSSEDLRIVTANSSISAAKKIDILETIFGRHFDKKFMNFLKILVEKNRFNEIENIKYAFEKLTEGASNLKTVEITSPIELNFENKTNILFKLEHKLNCEVKPVWKVDDSLIAGLVFKIGDTVTDTSIRTKLENLGKKING